MRATFFLVALVALITKITATHENEASPSTDEPPESSTELLRTESRRIARQLNIPGQEYVVRGHSPNRQIIKIPNNAKLKVVQQPMQKRVRQQQNQQGYKPKYQQQTGRPKRGPYDEAEEEYYDDADYAATNKKQKRTKNGYVVKDVTPEEFYEPEDYEVFQKKPKKKSQKIESFNYRNQPKKHRKQQYLPKYGDVSAQPSQVVERPERRPHYDEDLGYDFVRPTNRYRSQQESPFVSNSGYHDDGGYGYHDYSAASSITMKQVAPPNLAPNSDVHHDVRKEVHSVKKPQAVFNELTPSVSSGNRYEEYHQHEPAAYNRKSPSTRQIQSIFPQQYTTHNPFITRNLGLEEHERSYNNHQEHFTGEPSADESVSYQHLHQQHRQEYNHHIDDHEHQHISAASEQRPNLVPTGSSGIHIVNPPQFSIREQQTQHHSASNNQRATIRDIIRQDCPEAEKLGFCASPPRYPTQQINNVVKKCSDMLDAMYSPAPIDPEDDLSSFSSRSDSESDIEFVDGGNNLTNSIEQSWSKWSRSSNDGSNTVCDSLLTQTEPGYAREVNSGRWFVIMQTMDHIVQRIMTDTCERPGKPCGGLAGLKCSRTSNFHHGYKSTRCVQRFTQQRLISWDPEQPLACPKVRIFRFPTACLCHLSVE